MIKQMYYKNQVQMQMGGGHYFQKVINNYFV
jgi:hypothetical protein